MSVTTTKVRSRDGTIIAMDRIGTGPSVVLVDPAFGHRKGNPQFAGLATALAPDFAVFTYDRRGRGESTDTPPFAVEREIEDLEAVIAEAGGTACVFGHSSGAIIALKAAARGASIDKVGAYEPPFIIDNSRPPLPADYFEHLRDLITSGKRREGVEYFMIEAVGVPKEMILRMRDAPVWPGLERLAPTLLYDNTICVPYQTGKPLDPREWSSIKAPVLAITGGASPAWIQNSAAALARLVPSGRFVTLVGQTHEVNPAATAPALKEFFLG